MKTKKSFDRVEIKEVEESAHKYITFYIDGHPYFTVYIDNFTYRILKAKAMIFPFKFFRWENRLARYVYNWGMKPKVIT